jgi:glycopeptide antibiotics resistance protein
VRSWPIFVCVLVIAGVVLPWSSFQPHSHWGRVVWLPFSTPPPLTARDVIVNVLLYVPFGFLYAWPRPGSARVFLWSAVWAASLSIATEWTQVFSHARFPSATDVLLNTIGSAMGVALAALTRRR